MITVVAKNVLKSGTKETVLALLDELIALTRKETGNIRYELYQLDGAPDTLCFIEEWASREALAAHVNSEHFQRIIPQIAAYKVSETPIEIYHKIR
ncbi:MAG: antibiotic biosynthesis monooxygenase [Desulfobulbaceae bacterium]|jgi:quinol monooxygenase YgiN|nr:antibiotic biosynthesis monooxygenase [Desulfobulbaceae bacterium]